MREWNEEELKKLKELCKKMTLPHIALELNRTHHEVRYQIRKLGLRTQVPWKREFEEVSAIARFSEQNGVRKAAEHFGLTEYVVKGVRKTYRKQVREFAQSISPENLQRLRLAAIKHASQLGQGEIAQDFGSYCVIKRLTSRTVNFQFAWRDFLKELYGDLRNISGSIKAKGRLTAVPITEDADPESGVQVAAKEKKDSLALQVALDLGLKGLDRTIFMLHYQEGYTQKEISRLIDIHEATICLMLKEIVDRIQEIDL